MSQFSIPPHPQCQTTEGRLSRSPSTIFPCPRDHAGLTFPGLVLTMIRSGNLRLSIGMSDPAHNNLSVRTMVSTLSHPVRWRARSHERVQRCREPNQTPRIRSSILWYARWSIWLLPFSGVNVAHTYRRTSITPDFSIRALGRVVQWDSCTAPFDNDQSSSNPYGSGGRFRLITSGFP